MNSRIKELRKLFQLTQEELASRLNITSQCYSNYEQERRRPSPDLIYKIAEIFNVTIDFVLGKDQRPIKQIKNWDRYQQYKLSEANSEKERWDLIYEFSGLKDLMHTESSLFDKYSNVKPIDTIRIPLLGKIACGEPIWANEDRENYIMAGSNVKADFCLVCEGDSMINARIHDGDIVFIRQQSMVENGEIAAVIIENSVTLKRVYYYPEQSKLILQAENPKYPPFIYINEELNSIRILGKAVEFQSKVH